MPDARSLLSLGDIMSAPLPASPAREDVDGDIAAMTVLPPDLTPGAPRSSATRAQSRVSRSVQGVGMRVPTPRGREERRSRLGTQLGAVQSAISSRSTPEDDGQIDENGDRPPRDHYDNNPLVPAHWSVAPDMTPVDHVYRKDPDQARLCTWVPISFELEAEAKYILLKHEISCTGLRFGLYICGKAEYVIYAPDERGNDLNVYRDRMMVFMIELNRSERSKWRNIHNELSSMTSAKLENRGIGDRHGICIRYYECAPVSTPTPRPSAMDTTPVPSLPRTVQTSALFRIIDEAMRTLDEHDLAQEIYYARLPALLAEAQLVARERADESTADERMADERTVEGRRAAMRRARNRRFAQAERDRRVARERRANERAIARETEAANVRALAQEGADDPTPTVLEGIVPAALESETETETVADRRGNRRQQETSRYVWSGGSAPSGSIVRAARPEPLRTRLTPEQALAEGALAYVTSISEPSIWAETRNNLYDSEYSGFSSDSDDLPDVIPDTAEVTTDAAEVTVDTAEVAANRARAAAPRAGGRQASQPSIELRCAE